MKCASLFSGGIFRHNDQVSGGETNSAQLNYSFSVRNDQIALNFGMTAHTFDDVKPDNNCEWQIYRKWVIKWLQYVPCPVLQSLSSLFHSFPFKNEKQTTTLLEFNLAMRGRFRSFSREWHKRTERVKRGGIINDLHYKMIWREFLRGPWQTTTTQTYLFFHIHLGIFQIW